MQITLTNLQKTKDYSEKITFCTFSLKALNAPLTGDNLDSTYILSSEEIEGFNDQNLNTIIAREANNLAVAFSKVLSPDITENIQAPELATYVFVINGDNVQLNK